MGGKEINGRERQKQGETSVIERKNRNENFENIKENNKGIDGRGDEKRKASKGGNERRRG